MSAPAEHLPDRTLYDDALDAVMSSRKLWEAIFAGLAQVSLLGRADLARSEVPAEAEDLAIRLVEVLGIGASVGQPLEHPPEWHDAAAPETAPRSSVTEHIQAAARAIPFGQEFTNGHTGEEVKLHLSLALRALESETER